MNVIICGNFGKENQCGTCKNFFLWGVSSGNCDAEGEDYKEMMCTDNCDCEKYIKGDSTQEI